MAFFFGDPLRTCSDNSERAIEEQTDEIIANTVTDNSKNRATEQHNITADELEENEDNDILISDEIANRVSIVIHGVQKEIGGSKILWKIKSLKAPTPSRKILISREKKS